MMEQGALAVNLGDYLGKVEKAPDADATGRAYLGKRKRSSLWVDPPLSLGRTTPVLLSDSGEPVYHKLPHSPVEDIGGCPHPWSTWLEIGKRSLQPCRRLITGGPGQGKSLLLKMTARMLATDAKTALRDSAANVDSVRIPLVIPASFLAKQESEALTDVIRAWASRIHPDIADYIAETARESRTWFLIDTMDERAPERISWFFDAICEWESSLIVTSRTHRFSHVDFPFDVETFQMRPWSFSTISAFIAKWFEKEKGEPTALRLVRDNPSIRTLAGVPLLLTLVCWLSERGIATTSTTRPNLLGTVVPEILGRKRDSPREGDKGRAQALQDMLSDVMLQLFLRKAAMGALPRGELIREIAASQLQPLVRNMDAEQVSKLTEQQRAEALIDELLETGIIVPADVGNSAYFPAHGFFVEYLIAENLARRLSAEGRPDGSEAGDTLRLLNFKSWDPSWAEVIPLVAGMLENPWPLISLLARNEENNKDDYFRHRLALAGLCLGEVHQQWWQEHGMQVTSVGDDILACWKDHCQRRGLYLYPDEHPIVESLPIAAELRPEATLDALKQMSNSPGFDLRVWLPHLSTGTFCEVLLDWLLAAHREYDPTVNPSADTDIRLWIEDLSVVLPREVLSERLEVLLKDVDAFVRFDAYELSRSLGLEALVRRVLPKEEQDSWDELLGYGQYVKIARSCGEPTVLELAATARNRVAEATEGKRRAKPGGLDEGELNEWLKHIIRRAGRTAVERSVEKVQAPGSKLESPVTGEENLVSRLCAAMRRVQPNVNRWYDDSKARNRMDRLRRVRFEVSRQIVKFMQKGYRFFQDEPMGPVRAETVQELSRLTPPFDAHDAIKISGVDKEKGEGEGAGATPPASGQKRRALVEFRDSGLRIRYGGNECELGRNTIVAKLFGHLYACKKGTESDSYEAIFAAVYPELLYEKQKDGSPPGRLKTRVSDLGQRLRTRLGPPPNGKRWILTNEGVGYYLTNAVTWQMQKAHERQDPMSMDPARLDRLADRREHC